VTSNSDDPAPKNSALWIVLLTMVGIAFLVFSSLIFAGVIELDRVDGILNIIGGLVTLAIIPFISKARK